MVPLHVAVCMHNADKHDGTGGCCLCCCCHDMVCVSPTWRAEAEWPRQVGELLRKHGELALGYITQVPIVPSP